MPVDRAVERVLAGLQLGRRRRLPALLDGLAVLVDAAALDAHRVRDRRRVVHHDRDLAGLGLELVLVELEHAARVSGDLELLAAAAGAALAPVSELTSSSPPQPAATNAPIASTVSTAVSLDFIRSSIREMDGVLRF